MATALINMAFRVDKALHARLHAWARQEQCSVNSLFQACIARACDLHDEQMAMAAVIRARQEAVEEDRARMDRENNE